MEVGRVSATSVKMADTFHSKGSDRQCIVEILALLQVLLASNPHIGLKQCLPELTHSEPQKMMGYFTFFLMLNHQFNQVFPQDLSQNITDSKCG